MRLNNFDTSLFFIMYIFQKTLDKIGAPAEIYFTDNKKQQKVKFITKICDLCLGKQENYM